MGLTQILSTALDGLNASQAGLTSTGQNITNVNTPGYARRDLQLETRGQGLNGVNVAGLRRVADTVIERRQYQAIGLSSAASERDAQLGALEAMFDDVGGSGLSDALAAFYGAFSSLAANPSDPTARANVLARADALSGRISDTADGIASARGELLTKAQETTAEVNRKAQQIAQLNQQIVAARAQGQDTGNLEDQRAKVLLGLAPLVDVTVLTQGNGAVMVQASGATLVDEVSARTLAVDLSSNGDLRFTSQTVGGAPTDVTRYLTGGKLAGIKEARDVDLAQVATKLDDIAYGIQTTVNAQHAAGFGLDGVGSRNMFVVTTSSVGAARAMAVSSDVKGNPNAIAAASTAGTTPGGSDNAVLLSRLALQPAVGGRTVAQAYGDLVGDMGARKAGAADEVTLREGVANQMSAMRESASGVSLDEEMISLTKYQRAYEASTKLISTIDQLLEELLARLGR
ncbi:MAG TPA: flagellar hook-associated protein FlgK [Polyangiaceae bacterium]|nr:flagellar hook-associated protein FlgK [Polyangiaceae bacterium]